MLKSSMLSQACQRCWRRKQRCGKQTPQCAECLHAEVRCVPRLWGQSTGNGDHGVNNQVQQAGGLIEYMKQRIEYLESQNSVDVDRPATSSSHPTDSSPFDIDAQEQISRHSMETGSTQTLMEDAATDVVYLSLTAMGASRDRQEKLRDNMFTVFVQDIVSHHTTSAASNPLRSDVVSTSTTSLYILDEKVKALRQIHLRTLVNAFCEISRLLFPVIPTKEVIDAFELIFVADVKKNRAQIAQIHPEKYIYANIASAMGVLMTLPGDYLSESIRDLLLTSKATIPDIYWREMEISAIQCLALQVAASLYHPAGGSTWHLLGLALTRAISMGLHRQTTNQSSSDNGNDTAFAFWTLYVLDRVVAFSMCRPFGIDEREITLEIPTLASQHTLDVSNDICEALFTWKAHYVRLLSTWKGQPPTDLSVCFESHEYWQETWHELEQRLDVHKDLGDGDHINLLRQLARKDMLQLSCLGLVQMIQMACSKSKFDGIFFKIRDATVREVPEYFSHLQTCIDQQKHVLSFLDGYGILGASVVFVYCQTQPLNGELQRQRVSISHMRTLTKAMDILQTIGQQFTAIYGFKNLIWGFLSALEQQTDLAQVTKLASTSQAPKPIETLRHEIEICPLPVPSDLVGVMESCLQQT